jgi:hypothetical protein
MKIWDRLMVVEKMMQTHAVGDVARVNDSRHTRRIYFSKTISLSGA